MADARLTFVSAAALLGVLIQTAIWPAPAFAQEQQNQDLQQQQQMLSASLEGLSLVLYGKNLSQLG